MISFLVLAITFLSTYATDLPQQIHIALAGSDENGNPNGMTISWQTIDDTATSMVKYGTDQTNLAFVATGSSSSYFSTYDHHVVLENLEVNTKYFYQCGDDSAGWSNIHSFTSAPKSTDDYTELTIAVIGDMGTNYSENTIALLNSLGSVNEYKLIWHLGDISYADDAFYIRPLGFGYEEIWNLYMNEVQNFTSYFPYMVLPGNHEAECYSPACQLSAKELKKLSHFSAYNSRFRMPSVESNGAMNMWYSFNYGPVHFINIDTETDYEDAPLDEYTWLRFFNKDYNGNFGDQIAWLEADLKKANEERNIRPWILVGGHRPIYTVAECNSEGNPIASAANLQAAVEDLFYNYKVDLYLSGHQHSYERQYPTYNSTVDKTYDNPSFPVHIIDGSAGNIENLAKWIDVPHPEWSAFGDNTNFGMSLFTIYNSSTLRWRHLNSANGEVLDEFVLTKDH